MRKWLSSFILGVLFSFPSLASAQTNISFSDLRVQLWPEYDQPSMLVIYDFDVAPGTPLPARVTLQIPQDGNVIAVAFYQNNAPVNANFDGPSRQGDAQVITIIVDTPNTYHLEYYQPLTRTGNHRQFNYAWAGEYPVNQFSVRVQVPADSTSFTSTPALNSNRDANGLAYYDSQPVNLPAGTSYTLSLQYDRTSDTLVSPSSGVQPSQPLDQNTPGRVSANNYLPYIIGGLGLLLVLGGLGYYLFSRRTTSSGPRRRQRAQPADSGNSPIYCHQCGERARPNDRFCRVCGTRLRLEN